jgi:FkbM family methyltransferase
MITFNYLIDNKNIEINYSQYYECDKDWYLNPEPKTRDYVIKNLKQNSIVIDAGSQIGLYSILFSKICKGGWVYCFEPTDTYEMLNENIKLNNCDNITSIKKPLTNKVGFFKDKIYKVWSQQIIEHKEFEFETIDNFVNKNKIKLDLLKIDVDSYDYEVLLGSKKTLISQSPIVIVELNYALEKRGFNNDHAIDFMKSINYSIVDILDSHNYIFKKNK